MSPLKPDLNTTNQRSFAVNSAINIHFVMSITLDINNALKLVLPTLRFCDLQTDTTSKKAYKENIETSN